jgi:DHA3 family tetracycline resistance protein-like MFS transporter
MTRRADAGRVWLVYRGSWGLIGTLSWTTAVVYFIRDAGMSPLQLVLAGTALEVAYFCFEIPTAVVADLYSRRLSVIVAAVISGLAMILIGTLSFPAVVIVGMAVWGFGWTFRSGAEDAWLADEVGREHLGSAYQRGAQVARVTGLLGITGAVALALVYLWLPFIAAGVSALALASYLTVAMPEHGFTPSDRSRDVNSVATVLRTARAGATVVRRTPILALIVVIFVFVGAFQEGFDRLWEAQLLLEVGLPDIGRLGDVVWFGILGAATLILAFTVAAPLVPKVERLQAARLARLLLVLHAALMVCAFGFALAGTLWLAIATYLATAVIRDLTAAPLSTWLNESITDSNVRATVMSMTTVAGSFGEWAGGPALGLVGNRWGVRAALASASMLLAPALILFARAIRHHRPVLADPGATS